MKRNVVFIALFELTETYQQIAASMSKEIDAWFVTSTKKCLEKLQARGVPSTRILDLSATRREVRSRCVDPKEARCVLASFENHALSISSILRASRFFAGEPTPGLEAYMAEAVRRLDDFFRDKGVEWVVAEPTNAIELLAQLVCWKRGIRFAQYALTRQPSDRAFLNTDCFEAAWHKLAPSTREKDGADDPAAWLSDFRQRPVRPAYFANAAATRSLSSLARSLFNRMGTLARESVGLGELNDHTTAELARLYVRQKLRRIIRSETPAADELKTGRYLVYFLHVQPERSIDVVSPLFADQLSLIRLLRQTLPWNCELWVKEHPAATGAQPSRFYQELRRLNGVRLISGAVDSRELSRRALAVATVSGTIAYEAALSHVPAILFSDVFFADLPSVHRFTGSASLATHLFELSRVAAAAISPYEQDEKLVAFLEALCDGSVKTRWQGQSGELDADVLDDLATLLRRALAADGGNPGRMRIPGLERTRHV